MLKSESCRRAATVTATGDPASSNSTVHRPNNPKDCPTTSNSCPRSNELYHHHRPAPNISDTTKYPARSSSTDQTTTPSSSTPGPPRDHHDPETQRERGDAKPRRRNADEDRDRDRPTGAAQGNHARTADNRVQVGTRAPT